MHEETQKALQASVMGAGTQTAATCPLPDGRTLLSNQGTAWVQVQVLMLSSWVSIRASVSPHLQNGVKLIGFCEDQMRQCMLSSEAGTCRLKCPEVPVALPPSGSSVCVNGTHLSRLPVTTHDLAVASGTTAPSAKAEA